MEIIYDKKEMKDLCKDILFEVNELRQYVDIIVDENTMNTSNQLTAVTYAKENCTEIDRLLYLVDTMIKNRKVEDGNRYEDNTNSDTTCGVTGDNN